MTTLLSVPLSLTFSASTSGDSVVVPTSLSFTPASFTQPNRPISLTFLDFEPFAVTEGPDPQRARFEVIVDGTTIDPAQIHSLQVTRERKGHASAVLVVPRSLAQGWSSYTSPPTLGSIVSRLAPVPGKLNVTINGIYIVGGAKVTIPLITNGNGYETMEESGADGDRSTISIIGPGGKTQFERVTYSAPPGHKLTRAKIVRELATLAGVSSIAVQSSKKVEKPVELLDAEWRGFAEEYLDSTEGRDLRESRSGALICPVYGPESGRARDWTLDATRIRVDGRLGARAPGAAPTRAMVTTDRQVIEECGQVTAIEIINTFGTFAPQKMPLVQDSAGAVTSSSGATPSEVEQIIGRVEVFRTTFCDRTVVERTRTWGWKNPQVWRYTIDDAEAIDGYRGNTYLPSGTVKDDSNEGYLLKQEVFALLSETVIVSYYDANGFLRERLTAVAEWVLEQAALRTRASVSFAWDDTTNAPVVSPNRVLGDLTPVKDAPASVGTNEGEFYPNGGIQNVYGNGLIKFGILPSPPGSVPANAIDTSNKPPPLRPQPYFRQSEEHLRLSNETSPGGSGTKLFEKDWSSAKVELFRHDFALDDDGNETGGFLTKQTQFDYGYRRRKGTLKLYRDGFTGKDDEAHLLLAQIVETRYLAESDSSHSEIESKTKIGEPPTVVAKFGLQGYLPAAERDTSVSIDTDTYPDAPASTGRSVTQQLAFDCAREDLERYFFERLIEISAQWAEDEGELEDVCLRELREGSKIEVSIPIVGANFLVEPGDRALVRYPRLELEHDVYFDSVYWTWNGEGTPIVTDVKADLYVI